MGSLVYKGSNIGGGGTSIVELTKAEYDALPDSKNTDGVLYYVTDGDQFTAKNIACIDADGNQSTIQDVVDEQNNKLGGVRFGVNGEGTYGYFKADGSFVPFNEAYVVIDDSSFGIHPHDGNWSLARFAFNNIGKKYSKLTVISKEYESSNALGSTLGVACILDGIMIPITQEQTLDISTVDRIDCYINKHKDYSGSVYATFRFHN